MEVNAVSNYQPSFKGYLGSNIQIYVHRVVDKEVSSVVNEANANIKKVDVNKILAIKNLGYGVLDKFSNFVRKMDKKTSLDLDDLESPYIRLVFNNPISANKRVNVYGSIVFNKPKLSGGNVAIPLDKDLSKIYDASKDDLHTLDIIADHLFKLSSKEVDNVFFKSATSELKSLGESAIGFWSKFKVRKLAKKLDKFAKGLGIEPSARVRAEEYIRSANESKISYKNLLKEKKKFSKINQKIADEILKG